MSVISYIIGNADYPWEQPQPKPQSTMDYPKRDVPDIAQNVNLEIICDAAFVSAKECYDLLSDPNRGPATGYRHMDSLDDLGDVLPRELYNDERHWLGQCLGREPTRPEFFHFWLYWRMWIMKFKHDGGTPSRSNL
jgi:hypothetical protein